MPKDLSDNIITEIAKTENKPIFLVEIELDSGTLYFTDYDADVDFPSVAGHTYTTKGFSFDPAKTSLSLEVDSVEITFDNVDRTMSAYLASDDFQGRWLTIKKVFTNLLDSSNDAITVFSGRMRAPSVDEFDFSVSVVSLLNSLQRKIPVRVFQKTCPWEFGGTECGLTISGSPYTETGIAEAGSGTSVLVDASRNEADNYWKYGILTMTSGDNNEEKREILSSTALGVITFLIAFNSEISIDDTYSITRGCKKTLSECSGFSNSANFGGFPSVAREVMIK